MSYTKKQINYHAALRDPRWKEFRLDFIESRKTEHGVSECSDCGEDTRGSLHVHHRLYRHNSEPWEYDFSELRLICATCHARIHETEKRVRALVLTIAPHESYEFDDLLGELEKSRNLGVLKIALARCKSTIRETILQQSGA